MKTLKEHSRQNDNKNLPVVFNDDQVLKLVTWAATVDGRNLNEESTYMMVKELSALLNTRHWNLSMNEIQEAVRKGLAGDYGEYFTIGLKTYNNWITSFKMAKNRKQEQNDLKNSMSISERANFIHQGLKNRKK